MRLLALLAGLVLLGAACSSDDSDDGSTESSPDTTLDQTAVDEATDDATGDSATGDGAQGTPSEIYADPANWLCRPGVTGDACDLDLDATLVHPDGSTEPEPFEAAVDPPVDCFYVYPTISTDSGANSDRMADAPEIAIAANQAARFAEVCNVYAPIYRQIPLGALFSRLSSESDGTADDETDEETDSGSEESPSDIAYGDVRDAFMHYLAEDNDGRPFVLIGHSQGAGQLGRLIAEEIDPNDAIRSQMLSAMLIGGAVAVSGQDAYENVPACAAPTDTGCVISYASFYAGEPPPEDSLFGHLRGAAEGRAICTNPADPADPGALPLQSYFQAGHSEDAPDVDTPYIHYDGLLTGDCQADDSFDWLEIAIAPGVSPELPTDLGGRITPQWGSHLSDVNFAQGDLIELVRAQSSAG